MLNKLGLLAIVAALGVLPSPLIGAEGDDDAFVRLVRATELQCYFSFGQAAAWEDSEFDIEPAGEMVSSYRSIDLDAGTAELVGNMGSTSVGVHASPQGVTFIEQTPAGNLSILTVFPAQCGGPDRLCAVLSRHMFLVEEPVPSQFYGTCELNW